MAYQTINPFTEELVKTFQEHTDLQLDAIIATAEATYENDWSRKSLVERKASSRRQPRFCGGSATSSRRRSRSRWASCSERRRQRLN